MKKRKLLVTVLALTMCLGMPMTANAKMIVKNNMSALETLNTLNKNSSEIPKGSLQRLASQFKIEYTEETLEVMKKFFDADLYAKAYPDVAKVYGYDKEALWNHYVTYGLKEGRTQIHNNFNVFAYISAYPDLQNAFGNDLLAYYMHYVNYGINENRKYTTIDAVTKDGMTVIGINGQTIASPTVGNFTLDNGASSSESNIDIIVSDVPQLPAEPTTIPLIPEEPTSPTETLPSAPTEDTKEKCTHANRNYQVLGNGRHGVSCADCKENLPEEECSIQNNVCSKCGYVYKAEHEHSYNGVKQIEGTLTHGPVCTTCGYIDKENAVACSADGYEKTDDTHQKKCSKCGGVVEAAVSHEFTGWIADGETSHKATCVCGYEKVQDHNFDSEGVCSECEYKLNNKDKAFR